MTDTDLLDKQTIIHFTAFKKFNGLYPVPEAIENFTDRLIGCKTSKGTEPFSSQPLPLELISTLRSGAMKQETILNCHIREREGIQSWRCHYDQQT